MFLYVSFKNSLRSVYESIKADVRKLDENCKQTALDKQISNYCQNISQFLNARINLIDLYPLLLPATTFLKASLTKKQLREDFRNGSGKTTEIQRALDSN